MDELINFFGLLTFTALIWGCLLDRWLGEPRRWHPLVGFGQLAAALESRLNRYAADRPRSNRIGGLLAVLLLLAPLTLIGVVLQWQLLRWSGSLGGAGLWLYPLVGALVFYWALGWRSLVLHLQAIEQAMQLQDIELARDRVGRIVSRDCQSANWVDLRRAAIESALENTSDAIVAPMFWFLWGGIPGVVLYRLSNTLDAMWGYRNARYRQFGWAAARLDDLLNYLPARLTALSFVLMAAPGHRQSALQAWRTQARACASPNAGPVICAGAGALGLRLGGAALYHGELISKPWMGQGRDPEAMDLTRSLRLIRRSLFAILGALGIGTLLFTFRQLGVEA